MIYSMTGYARHEIKGDWGSAIWEIRSLNQRYLETFIRTPELVRSLEPVVRERIRQKLARGKVECNLRFVANPAAVEELKINEHVAEQVLKAVHKISAMAGESNRVNPFQVLQWDGVIEAPEQDMDNINKALLNGFNETLEIFVQTRANEGENLKNFITKRLIAIRKEVETIREKMPEILQWQRERLINKFKEAKIELDPTRLEQEIVILAQKSDVAEELDRLESHISETKKILTKGGAVGRRLDFMMQEFNREANTLGSKSISNEITSTSVELKVLIEQMREQIQNIE